MKNRRVGAEMAKTRRFFFLLLLLRRPSPTLDRLAVSRQNGRKRAKTGENGGKLEKIFVSDVFEKRVVYTV